jgi:predicted O-linked N-acetylglucosamine transferase (SPINDLY family)
VDEWRETAGLSDADLAGLIRRDRIDVLVDLTLHMANDRLLVFARQPAPVQVSWLGYPGSTGLEAVSAEFTDPWLSPREDATGEAEDRFERLPDCFWCYDPGATEPPVGPLPAERNGFVTWGCLNNFCKVTDETLAMWAEVMRLVPDSRLILLAPPGSARARVLGRLGVEAGRVEFVGYQPRADYLKVYQRIDLGLDTFPYTGHTTSLDALWMGVPLVSRAGRTAVSRGSLSVLGNLGLNGLVADTREQFARIAVEWAGQPERLSALHTGLRERLIRSPVMDGARFARNFEQACRSRWRRWCRGGAATGAGIRPLGGESG